MKWFQSQAADAVEESKKAYKQIDDLKRKHEKDVCTCSHLLANSCPPKETVGPVYHDSNMAGDDPVGLDNNASNRGRDDFESFYSAEESTRLLEEPSSWFSGYDRCNI